MVKHSQQQEPKAKEYRKPSALIRSSSWIQLQAAADKKDKAETGYEGSRVEELSDAILELDKNNTTPQPSPKFFFSSRMRFGSPAPSPDNFSEKDPLSPLPSPPTVKDPAEPPSAKRFCIRPYEKMKQ